MLSEVSVLSPSTNEEAKGLDVEIKEIPIQRQTEKPFVTQRIISV